MHIQPVSEQRGRQQVTNMFIIVTTATAERQRPKQEYKEQVQGLGVNRNLDSDPETPSCGGNFMSTLNFVLPSWRPNLFSLLPPLLGSDRLT